MYKAWEYLKHILKKLSGISDTDYIRVSMYTNIDNSPCAYSTSAPGIKSNNCFSAFCILHYFTYMYNIIVEFLEPASWLLHCKYKCWYGCRIEFLLYIWNESPWVLWCFWLTLYLYMHTDRWGSILPHPHHTVDRGHWRGKIQGRQAVDEPSPRTT